MILKLAGDRALDGPVTRIVDAWRIFRGVLDCAIELRRRRQRQAKDAAAMVIFHQRIEGGLARTPAHRQNAEFASKRDEAFEQKRRTRLRGFGASTFPCPRSSRRG